MEVCDARRLPLLLSSFPPFRPSFFLLTNSHFRFFCCKKNLGNAFKVYPQRKMTSRCSTFSIMAVRRPAKNDAPSNRLCKILWCMNADLADGQQLYITGDPIALGCWEPKVAVLLSSSPGDATMWKAEIKVPLGINFKYNYFIKDKKQSSSSIRWREGPDFSLSVPMNCKKKDKVIARDSWMMEIASHDPVHSWGSWLLAPDTFSSQPAKKFPCQVSSSGGGDDLSSQYIHSSDLQLLKDDLLFNVKLHTHGNGATDVVDDFESFTISSSERDDCCEEPWLLYSPVSDSLSGQTEISLKPQNKELSGLNAVKDEEDSELSVAKDPVSTVILINSSVCTMQRIAVLEDGKLVELLLEPVKNNVQCDSVYLGIVTKLVPHMGGAFVDIGMSRPSLMEIKPNRKPFAYPPFSTKLRESKKEALNLLEMKHHVEGTLKVENNGDKEFLHKLQDDEEQFMHEDLEDHGPQISLEPFVTHEGHVNGTSIDYDGDETDCDDDFDDTGDNYEETNCDPFSPLYGESLNDVHLSSRDQEDLKVPNGTSSDLDKWACIVKGTKLVVQVVKEGLGTKGPALSPYPCLKSRFLILSTRCDRVGVSKKIVGVERTRLRVIAKTLQPRGFGLTVRTVAVGHSMEELQKDLVGLLSTWKDIIEHAKSAAIAADEGVNGVVPVILHRAMGQTLSVVQDYFNEKVNSMIVDSQRTYHEVTSYLHEIAPNLCDRVKLYHKRVPIFDHYGVEEEINNMLTKRVSLSNGGSLVIEQTEALVSIDVNGGHGMLGQGTSQEKAILDVNLTAARQIARELRLRDIGGIIVVDFIDMDDDAHKRLVYEEMKKAVELDRSMVKVSELSRHGLMEITRKRVRPSVTFMISEPCTCCHATGRVESLETTFSKIEHEICRLLAISNQKSGPENAKSWPKLVLMVDRFMCNYLTSGKRTKLAVLCSSLKVWILLKVARGFSRGVFEVKPFAEDKDESEKKPIAISALKSTENGSYISSGKLTLFPVKKWKATRK